MKAIIKLRYLVKNLASFLSALSSDKKFYWGSNRCRSINTTIDDTAVVYGNYSLENVTIGYSSYVSHNATIANTTIGKFCSIGPNVVIGWGIHPIDGISTHPAFYSSNKRSKVTFCDQDSVEEHRPITIGNDVFIGANVTILDGITIGDGAVIGAGAVVSKDIPPYAVAVGCPIKIVKYRFSEETIQGLVDTKWWNKNELYDKVATNFGQVDTFLKDLNNLTVNA